MHKIPKFCHFMPMQGKKNYPFYLMGDFLTAYFFTIKTAILRHFKPQKTFLKGYALKMQH